MTTLLASVTVRALLNVPALLKKEAVVGITKLPVLLR